MVALRREWGTAGVVVCLSSCSRDGKRQPGALLAWHCNSSVLICLQAWFRELPAGILDLLSPAEMATVVGEASAVGLVQRLPVMQRSLLDWAVNLMADVVECQRDNRMNSRNIAMVFAPNLTQVNAQKISCCLFFEALFEAPQNEALLWCLLPISHR